MRHAHIVWRKFSHAKFWKSALNAKNAALFPSVMLNLRILNEQIKNMLVNKIINICTSVEEAVWIYFYFQR